MKTFSKMHIWIWTHAGAFAMTVVLLIDSANSESILFWSGYTAALFLVITLCLTPLKLLKPQWSFITKLNRFRREFGVSAFTYSAVHLIAFGFKQGGIIKTVPFLLHPAIITASFIAFPILLILTLTSNKVSIKRLGFLKWKRLHQKVYWAEGAIIVHLMLVGQSNWALLIFGPLLTLQLLRIRRKREVQPSPTLLAARKNACATLPAGILAP